MHTQLSFGQWLRQQRRERDLTRDECAQIIGCAPDSLKRWELERGKPSKAMLQRIFQIFDTPPEARTPLARAARPPQPPPPETTPQPRLPNPLTMLYGRDEAITTLVQVIAHDQPRLLTLIGPAGVGKTRLALAVAAAIAQQTAIRVVWAPLAEVNSPDQIPAALWRALDGPATLAADWCTTLSSYIKDQPTLLVVDNCEHLLSGALTIKQLIEACPNLTILATSRERWRLSGEWLWQVQPLPIPDPATHPSTHLNTPSAQLIIQRIRSHKPWWNPDPADVTAISTLCQTLQGLPLALELAAAHTRWTPIPTLAAELERLLPLLRDDDLDRPARQMTLWHALDWSFRSLDAPLRTLTLALAPFHTPWTLTEIIALAPLLGLNPDLLGHHLQTLVDKQWLTFSPAQDGGRFEMLFVMREYLLTQAADDAAATLMLRRFCSTIAAWLAETIPDWRRPTWHAHCARLWQRYPDILRAAQWAAHHDPSLAIEIAQRMYFFWADQALANHFATIADPLLPLCPTLADPDAAFVLYLKALASHPDTMLDWYYRSLQRYEAAADDYGIALLWVSIGGFYFNAGDYERTTAAWAKGILYRERTGIPSRLAISYLNLGVLAMMRDDFSAARAAFNHGLSLVNNRPEIDAQVAACSLLLYLAELAIVQQDVAAVERALRQARPVVDRFSTALMSFPCINAIAWAAWHNDDLPALIIWLRETLPINALSDSPQRKVTYLTMAATVFADHAHATAALCFQAARAIATFYSVAPTALVRTLNAQAATTFPPFTVDPTTATELWEQALAALKALATQPLPTLAPPLSTPLQARSYAV